MSIKKIEYTPAKMEQLIVVFDDKEELLEFNVSDVFLITDVANLKRKLDEIGLLRGKDDIDTIGKALETLEETFDKIFNKKGLTRQISRMSDGVGLETLQPINDILDHVFEAIKETDNKISKNQKQLQAKKMAGMSELEKTATKKAAAVKGKAEE